MGFPKACIGCIFTLKRIGACGVHVGRMSDPDYKRKVVHADYRLATFVVEKAEAEMAAREIGLNAGVPQPKTKEELQEWLIEYCRGTKNHGEPNTWDVTRVTDMSWLFYDFLFFQDFWVKKIIFYIL